MLGAFLGYALSNLLFVILHVTGSGSFPRPVSYTHLIGALIIIILFALLVWRGISISLKAKDKFGSLLGIGLSAQVGLQVILNIACLLYTSRCV